MKQIITSILDDDLYKFSTQCAIMELFPDAMAKYRFINRGKQRFSIDFVNALNEQIASFADLRLLLYEKRWFREKSPYLKPWYFDYLENYRYDPKQVHVSLSDDLDNNLVIGIEGKWHETVLWEVKLMAVISQLYFETIDKNWNMDGQREKAKSKADILGDNGCNFTDFGTRRRRNFATQNLVVDAMKSNPFFMGTSNVLLAMNHGVRSIGTYPHEWIMGNAILESLQCADYYAMHNWSRVFNAQLGTALTDTYGFDSFLRNFNTRLAKMFDSIRNDSGDEFEFVDKAVAHYKKLGINPMYKFIVFSNALDCNKCIAIKKYCDGKINCSFGIGTKFSNDFKDSSALNMVIKLSEINGMSAVKLSDDKGKEMGRLDAIRVMKWIHRKHSLD